MKILMVCLGNICRSPLAHGIMENISKERDLGWQIDSAGTSGWHNGEKPDRRSIQVASHHGIDISNQSSQKIKPSDLDEYDLIFAMDKSNLRDIRNLAKGQNMHKIHLFLEYGDIKERAEVPDPYYTGGFEYVYDLVEKACQNIADKILDQS